MTVAQIAAKFRSGNVQAAQVLDSGLSPVLGQLNREVAIANNTNAMHMNSHIRQSDGSVYWVVRSPSGSLRFYKAYPGAILIRLAGPDPVPLPLAGAAVTQGVISGVMAENYVAGDAFAVILGETGGPFAAGAVTFGGGGSDTITTREDNLGEWAVDFETVNLTLNTVSYSGLHMGIMPSGAQGLCCTFQRAGTAQVTVTFDPTLAPGSQWVEIVRGATASLNGASGSSFMHNNILWWNYRSVSLRAYHFFNPEADVAGGFVSTLDREGAGHAACGGRLFGLGETGTSILTLIELTPGAAAVVDTVPSGVGAARWNIPNAGSPYLFCGEDDQALYAVESLASGVGVNRQMARWIIDPSSGVVTRNGPILSGPTELDIGEAFLDPARRIADTISLDHWKSYRDIETLPGSAEFSHYWFQAATIAALQYKWAGWLDMVSGNPVTWDGTNIVQFPSAHGLAIGQWIRHNTTNLAFRVVAIPSTVNAEIDTTVSIALGFAIPNTSSVTSLAQVMLAVAPTGLILAYDLPDEFLGGGDSTWTPGEKHPDLIGKPLAVPGGERQTWLGYNGVGTFRATGWYQKKDGVISQMNFTGATQGGPLVIIGNEIQGITADGLTPFQVTWLSEGQGIGIGEIVAKWLVLFI